MHVRQRIGELGPGCDAEHCGVYLLPKGATLVKLQYQGNFDDEPTSWKV